MTHRLADAFDGLPVGWLTETIRLLIKILMTIDVKVAKTTRVREMIRIQFGSNDDRLIVCDLITIRN